MRDLSSFVGQLIHRFMPLSKTEVKRPPHYHRLIYEDISKAVSSHEREGIEMIILTVDTSWDGPQTAVTVHEIVLADSGNPQLKLQVKLPNGITQTSYSHFLFFLAVELHKRHHGQQAPADLASSIIAFQEVLSHPTADVNQPIRAQAMRELGCCLLTRFRMSGERPDFEKSCQLERESIALNPTVYPGQISRLWDLGTSFFAIFEEAGLMQDLDEAIVLLRELLAMQSSEPRNSQARRLTAEAGSPSGTSESEAVPNLGSKFSRSRILRMLMNCVQRRFRELGFAKDLDEAVQLCRDTLEICVIGHPEHQLAVADLASVLHLRFEQFGAFGDLHETVRLYHKCLESSQDPTADVVWRSNLAAALLQRYKRGSNNKIDTKDLDEAIGLVRESLIHCPPDHNAYDALLIHLSIALTSRFTNQRMRSDIEEAVLRCQEAVDCCRDPEWSLGYAVALFNLAEIYEIRFRAFRDVDDAESALKLGMEVLDKIDARTGGRREPSRSLCLSMLSSLYLMPGTPFRDTAKALEYLSESMKDHHTLAEMRLRSAINVMRQDLASDLIDDRSRPFLAQVLTQIVHLLPQLVNSGMCVRSRLRALRMVEGLPTAVAVRALHLDEPSLALEMIEEGRAIFWSEALRLRMPFEDAPVHLRKRLVELANELERDSLHQNPALYELSKPEAEAENARKRRLTEELESLLAQVRASPGLERFMLPETCAALVKAAERGPIVMLLSSIDSCNAVLITPTGKVKRVPLSVTADQLRKWSILFKDATSRSRAALSGVERVEESVSDSSDLAEIDELARRYGAQDEEGEAQKEAQNEPNLQFLTNRALKDSQPINVACNVLKALWITVVKPIIETLGLKRTSGRNRPRLWWCPTAEFAFLPLHAAGDYVKGSGCCSEFVVSSYIPTLSSLLDARRTVPQLARADTRVLLAAVPRPYEGRALPNTIQEVRAVREIVPCSAVLELPSVNDAGITKDTALHAFPQATILHLACHGRQNHQDPIESGFILQDEMLTIDQLMPLRQSHAFLAFLSACETAKGDSSQPDQAIHLAATMLFVGFKSVIGTMWSMDDQDGPLVASVVYKQLFDGDAEYLDSNVVPYALDDAVQRLRQSKTSPARWAQYIHIGI